MPITTELTAKMVIAIREKYPDVPLFEYKKDAKVTKTDKGTVLYAGLTFKQLDGSFKPLRLGFKKQLIGIRAKKAEKANSDSRYINLGFCKITMEELKKSQYAATMSEAKLQELLDINDEYIRAMDIIADEIQIMLESLAKHYRKDIKPSSPNYYNIRQMERDATEEELQANPNLDKIKLETPFYRTRLGITREIRNGKPLNLVGNSFPIAKGSKERRFDNIVYNVNERDADDKPMPACIIETIKGREVRQPLTLENAGEFVTRMSIAVGHTNFEQASISSMGYSCAAHTRKLYVVHHPRIFNDGLTEEDEDAMADFRSFATEAKRAPAQAPDVSTAGKKKSKSKPVDDEEEDDEPPTQDPSDDEHGTTDPANEAEDDDEEGDDDGEEVEVEMEAAPPSPKVKSTKGKKPAK